MRLYLRVCINTFILTHCIYASHVPVVHITRWFYSYDVSMFCIRSRNTLYNNSYILITSANFKWRDLATENSRLGHALRQISNQKLAFSSIK